MKRLLILLLIAICGIGYRSATIMEAIGLAKPAVAAEPASVDALMASAGQKAPAGMSLTEYAELARKDPDAYRKLFASHQQDQERSELDKLMNFLTRLKYE
jgi:hypothetical protein